MKHAERSWNPKQAGLLCLALLIGCLVAYHRVGSHGYVAYDDDTYVYQNAQVLGGLSAEGLRWALGSASYGANWHPLTWISHMLDVQLFGADSPGAAHWENVLMHAGVACLFFLGLLRATGRKGAAFLAAALFAWHPLRVESVAWISERKDVLSGLMLCLSVWSYTRWCRRPGALAYTCVLLSLALGLMAKPMLVTVPALFLVLDAWPLGRLKGRADLLPRIKEKLPLFGLALVSAWFTFKAQSSDGVVSDQVPMAVTWLNALASVGSYLTQSLWPANLGCLYPLASSISAEPLELLTLPALLGALWMLGLSTLAWRLRNSFPALAAGWIWYLISLLPVIGLIQVGAQAHADRYTYIPLLGLVAALALGLDRLAQARPGLRMPLYGLSAAVLAALLLRSEQQTASWENSHTLFEQALSVEPRNPIALGNAGYAWQQEGDHQKAREYFERSLAVGAPQFSVQINLSQAYLQLDLLGECRALLYRLSKRYPGKWLVQSQLGELEFRSQNFELARQHFETSIAMGSINENDQLQLGLLKLDTNPSAALQHFSTAIAWNPYSAKAYYALAQLYLGLGQPESALPFLERAVELSPSPPAQLTQALAATRKQLSN